MIVRLTTDASLCSETKTGAWAAVIRGRRGYEEHGGVMPGRFGGVNGLEMHALAQGLRLAVERGAVAAGDHLEVQTDSWHAANRLSPAYVSRRNKRRLRRGLEPTRPDTNPNGSPMRAFLAMAEGAGVTFEVTRSRQGLDLAVADMIAHRHMAEERARRRGLSPEDAKLAVFEEAMDEGRVRFLKQAGHLKHGPR